MRRTLYIVATVCVLTFVFVPTVTLTTQSRSWVDAVSGSMKRETVPMFGRSSGEVVEPSALDIRLRQAGVAWTPDWRFLHNVRRGIFGGAVSYECGMAPPIYQIRSVLDHFSRISSDEQLRAFVGTMRSASENEQRAAVELADEKGLQAMAARPGG